MLLNNVCVSLIVDCVLHLRMLSCIVTTFHCGALFFYVLGVFAHIFSFAHVENSTV